MKLQRKSQAGFSLVELMIVVAIIGILAALAVPRFQTFQAKAKAAEGKTMLANIYTLELSYHADNDTYGSLVQIGCNINGQACPAAPVAAAKIRFGYGMAEAQNGFLATATSPAGSLGSCHTANYVIKINENKIIGDGTLVTGDTTGVEPKLSTAGC